MEHYKFRKTIEVAPNMEIPIEKKVKQTKISNTRKVNLCLKLTSALGNHVVLLAFFRVCYIYDFSQNGVYGSENK